MNEESPVYMCVCVCVCVCNLQKYNKLCHTCMLSHVQFYAIPWTIACQAPLSMGFSRQDYWSGLPCPFPGDLPNPGVEPRSPALQGDCLLPETLGVHNKLATITKEKQTHRYREETSGHQWRWGGTGWGSGRYRLLGVR